jgi:hypothetical protein
MSRTRATELLRFVEAALGHLDRAQKTAFEVARNRSIEQAAARLQDMKLNLEAERDAVTESIVRQRAGEGS